MDELKPCPFCGAGDTQIKESKMWTGMRNQIISATVMHWCSKDEGQPQSVMQIAGKDRESAIAKWNSRA
jgi:hypothetical protein